VFSPPAHPAMAILEPVRSFDYRMMLCKFRDDISNGSGVIVLTDKPVGDKISAPSPNCHGNKDRPHNILHGYIVSAIPENPL